MYYVVNYHNGNSSTDVEFNYTDAIDTAKAWAIVYGASFVKTVDMSTGNMIVDCVVTRGGIKHCYCCGKPIDVQAHDDNDDYYEECIDYDVW